MFEEKQREKGSMEMDEGWELGKGMCVCVCVLRVHSQR